MEKNIKVMHFAHWTRSGITSLIKMLTDSKNDSFVLLLEDEGFDNYYENIENKISLNFNKWRIFHCLKLLRKFYLHQSPNIVHVHSFTPFLLACFICTKSRLVLHIHNEYPYLKAIDFKSRVKRAFLKTLLGIRDVTVVTVTDDVRRLLETNFKKDAIFVPNGVPDKGNRRPDFTKLKSRNKFFSVCRVECQKNLEMAIEVIDLVSKKYPIVYHIYGEGPQKKNLVNLVKSKNLQDIVFFKGFCDAPELLANAYDFYLSCSNYEGLSLSIANALRGGNVVIMTPVGELKNYINDGLEGIIIDFNKRKAASKIEALLSMDDDSTAVLQRNGRRLYEENFTESKFLKNVDSIYKKILSDNI
jgi:glycosyltransferase involved in cell wall biosynthesis